MQKVVSCVARLDYAKAGKDIIYLRDVMAGGEEVRAHVARSLSVMRANREERATITRARTVLGELERRWPQGSFNAAVRELAEREKRKDPAATAADIVHISNCWHHCSADHEARERSARSDRSHM